MSGRFRLAQILVLSIPMLATPLRAEPAEGHFGVVVMAHGGDEAWNRSILEAIDPIRGRFPVEVAFGMADACTVENAVRNLERRGVQRIGVVRLFVSGESFLERTEQILGLRPGAPARSEAGDAGVCAQGSPHALGGHPTAAQPAGARPSAAPPTDGRAADPSAHLGGFFRVESPARLALSSEGLLDADEAGEILADRARSLSSSPAEEDVLILAHGPADDAENARWLTQLEARAAPVRALGFHSVKVETLREDWPEKRKEVEERIRATARAVAGEGHRLIVLPFRLSGFGPYAKVLEGESYAANGTGLVPHDHVTTWIDRQAAELERKLR